METHKKVWYTRWWMIVVYVLVGLVILGNILPESNNASKNNEKVVNQVEVVETTEEPSQSYVYQPENVEVEENNDKITVVSQTQEIAKGVTIEQKNSNQIVPIGNSFEHTQNGYTLIVDDYTFEKKTDTYGILRDITFIIKNNQGSNSLIPQMTLKITDKKNSKYTVYTDIDLSEYIEDGESIKRTVMVDLDIGASGNIKEMGVILADWGRVITSAYSNVNFSQQPKLG